jgi:hypothetical protein
MYYIGSHTGDPNDGYLSSSRWLNAEINFRPADFKRKIIKYVSEDNLKTEEYRLLNYIKENEFGKKYYNLKHGKPKGSAPWNKGKTGIWSDEQRKNISEHRKGKPTTKGRKNPQAAENGRKGAAKMSAKVTGRKKKILPDGSWIWEYPNK